MRTIVGEASASIHASKAQHFRPSLVRERFIYAESSTTTKGNTELELIGGEMVGSLLLSFLHELRF